MGEAKRRKKLDPNYGKAKNINLKFIQGNELISESLIKLLKLLDKRQKALFWLLKIKYDNDDFEAIVEFNMLGDKSFPMAIKALSEEKSFSERDINKIKEAIIIHLCSDEALINAKGNLAKAYKEQHSVHQLRQ